MESSCQFSATVSLLDKKGPSSLVLLMRVFRLTFQGGTRMQLTKWLPFVRL